MSKDYITLLNEEHVSIESIQSLFNENFFGPQQVEKTFGFYPAPEQLPAIPFSFSQLEFACKNDFFLVLHIDTFPDGKPLTIETMSTIHDGNNGKRSYDNEWCMQNAFYNRETPRTGWRLYANNILANSIGNDDVEQADAIVQYLEQRFFKNEELPGHYRTAINEYDVQKPAMLEIIKTNGRGEAPEITEALMLNKLARATPVEMVQYFEMQYKNTGDYFIYEDNSMDIPIRTCRRCDENTLVDIVNMENEGLFICSNHRGFDDPVGILLSLGNK